MHAVFVEMPAFSRHRAAYLDNDGLCALQQFLLRAPEAGDVIVGTGGLRKLRFSDDRRQRGKRGGLRVIYFHWPAGSQFWLFTLYGKGVQDDLDAMQKRLLKRMLEAVLLARTT
ncbi:toxin [Stenotrophomonas rhizophila]|jgi:hypothetical protein|uniref:Toxin n=1 Tax=Stenotrophomonas rhizophila TaxID=216778 RepID=A0AAP5AKX8_9GAMM|nr:MULTISPECIES: toxin [Stenotrophomonas]MDQ1063869.1 hypothetical protein [Stenotrophomonas sp. SORGH_AS_0282]MDQ1109853.1 hypothetical protein [Stenotrophomonas rhizophila]MDQ1187763.1 hypothetical protein [Stenotrophomonas sp. SORGH_AS_0282]PAK90505.1 toxin [Stenotrophomonas rhizophila]UQY88324.1 type II toxin-antitoxin system RelE/ParE family toxin [Stenotrophomonas rhizophila]